MPKTQGKLTDKESHFISEYLIDKNIRRAAIAAGYAPKNARHTGWTVLQKPYVKEALQQALEEQQARTLIQADMVLKRIDRLAEKAEACGDLTAAIRANQLLGQHYKLFTEKHEHGGIGGGAIIMQVTSQDEKL